MSHAKDEYAFNTATMENMAHLFGNGELLIGTTNGSADTEDPFEHGLEGTPRGFHVLSLDKGGVIYAGGTANDGTNIYLRSNLTSVTFQIYVF